MRIERLLLWVLLATSPSVNGCVLSRMEDFDFNPSVSEQSGAFVPDVYVEENSSKLVMPPYFIDWPKPPHDLVMLLFDQTYKQTSEGFEFIVIESMEVSNADAPPIQLISPDTEIEQRTYAVAKRETVLTSEAKLRFPRVIAQKSFVVTMHGYAIDESGKRFPFHCCCHYEYNGREWFFGPYSV